MKSLELLSLLPRRPEEFLDRTSGALANRFGSRLHRRPEYSLEEWRAALDQIGSLLQTDLAAILEEPELACVASQVQAGVDKIPFGGPLGLFNNGDLALARLCYAVVRALHPLVVVETGVCYGVTSSFILGALKENGSGILYSIDLPPLGRDADQFIGCVVPEHLRKRWHLFRGASKRLLPKILREVGAVDFFLHDSLHTYGNMRREFEIITRNLCRPAVVVADDIDGNPAFPEWVAESRPSYWASVAEESKKSVLGVAVFGPKLPKG